MVWVVLAQVVWDNPALALAGADSGRVAAVVVVVAVDRAFESERLFV